MQGERIVMNIRFKVTLKELDDLDQDGVLRVFGEFQNFMLVFEERMTFAEAEKYWDKYDKVEKYIKKRFKIDNPERVIHDMIYGYNNY